MTAGELSAGSVFATRLRVERKLGEGGMGVVYEVTQLSTGQRAALKVLGAEGCFDDEVRKRFLLEARQTPSDVSEHVVRVLDADVTDGRPWILMELLDGVTLRDLVATRGRLSPPAVLDVMEQLCHGLGGAHARGIVHRDLKPENVFVCESKRSGGGVLVKLLDFGISKILRAPRASTSASLVIGTEGWWAPEQTLAGSISTATDVWALGLLVYWMLTGAEFFDATSSSMVFPPASVRAREQGREAFIPAGFDGWFACCVALEPKARFVDASAAWNALRRSLTQPPPRDVARTPEALAQPPSAPPASKPAPPRRSRARTFVLATMAFVGASVAALYALGAASVFERRSPMDTSAPAGSSTAPTDDAEVMAVARAWDSIRAGAGGVGQYYAPSVRFRGSGEERVQPWQAERYWRDFASFPATLSFDWSAAQVRRETVGASRDVPASCVDAPRDSDEVLRVEVPSVEDNSHSQTGCSHIEAQYLLRLVRSGGRLVICHESHVLDSLCQACPTAAGCRR